MIKNYHLPENAEASILGCILLCPDTKPAVAGLITEADFSSTAYGAMFSAAMDPPDWLTLYNRQKATEPAESSYQPPRESNHGG